MFCIVDTETSGLDPKKDCLLEVAAARYDEEDGLIDCESHLMSGTTNEHVEAINGIKQRVVKTYGYSTLLPIDHVAWGCRALVAHNAEFDKKFLHSSHPIWVCSMRDIEWPNEQGRSVSLEKLALAHGVAVLPGHRAILDVLTLVRVFDAVRERHGSSVVGRLIDRAMRPKAICVSHQPFGRNELAYAEGFRFNRDKKRWQRTMAIEDWEAKNGAWPFDSSLILDEDEA